MPPGAPGFPQQGQNGDLQVSTSKIIDGKAAAARVLAHVKADVQKLKLKGIEPALAVILVGEDPASQ
ncbi:hypothetical protein KMS84_39665, partial [Streptomyces sp. IBSBF 2807]|nr:hypothetical protein [Streptomyces hilarionis]